MQLADLPLGQPLVRDLHHLLVHDRVRRLGVAIVLPYGHTRPLSFEAGRGRVGDGGGVLGDSDGPIAHPTPAEVHHALVADLQALEAGARVDRQVFAGHRVEARRPSVAVAVLPEVLHAGGEVFRRAQRPPAGDGDRIADHVRDQPAALGDQEVVLVRAQRERGERAPRVRAPDAVDVLRRRLPAVAQDHRPQQKHEDVQARDPARDLQRDEEAPRVDVPRAHVRRRDQDSVADGLPETDLLHDMVHARRLGAGRPEEMRIEHAQALVTVGHDGEAEDGRHHQGPAQRGGIALRAEPPAEDQHVEEQQAGHDGVLQVEAWAENLGAHGQGQRQRRHPPGQLLAPGQVARHLQQGEAGEEHHQPAAARDVQRHPFREAGHGGGAARPQRGEDVEHADHADDERHHRVEVAPAQLAHAPLALHAARPEHGRHRQHDRGQHPHAHVLDLVQVALHRRPAVVAGQAQRQGPDQHGREVHGGEDHRPHADRAAGGGDHHAQAERPPAGQHQPHAAARGEVDPLRVLRALALAPLQPAPAAGAGGAVVDLVAAHGGRHGHRDHDGQVEDAAVGHEGPREQEGLSLDDDAGEEDEVAVPGQERFHPVVLFA